MSSVKKSIYLDEDVAQALKSSAKLNERSETKQINFLLRTMLLGPEGAPAQTVYYGLPSAKPFTGPDPKSKPKLKAVPPSAKMLR